MHNADTAVYGERLRDVDVKVGEARRVDLVAQLRHTDHLFLLVLDREAQDISAIK